MKILLLIKDPLEARTTVHLLNELGHEATAAPSIELGTPYAKWCDVVWADYSLRNEAANLGKPVYVLQDPNDTILDPGLNILCKPVFTKQIKEVLGAPVG